MVAVVICATAGGVTVARRTRTPTTTFGLITPPCQVCKEANDSTRRPTLSRHVYIVVVRAADAAAKRWCAKVSHRPSWSAASSGVGP
jgi:hypothetical protein